MDREKAVDPPSLGNHGAATAARGARRAAALALACALLPALQHTAAAPAPDSSAQGTVRPAVPFGVDGLSFERIFSEPRLEGEAPRDVEWSPKGPVVAYLWSQEGRRDRDLWVYDAIGGLSRRVAEARMLEDPSRSIDAATAERRETMRIDHEGVDGYDWSPDGRSLLFTCAGDLFLASADGAAPKRLTQTESPEFDPQFSPDGSRVAFVRDNDLWVVTLADGSIVQATTDGSETLLNGLSDYISLEELGRHSAYRWSADGRWILYIQADTSPIRPLEIPDYLGRFVSHRLQRRPLAGEANSRTRVGVVAASGGETRWIALQDGIEDFFVPDLAAAGNEIALLQQDRSLQSAWLYLIEPETASARRILEEKDDAWINLEKAFLGWDAAGGSLVHGSERSGWGHLYRVDPATGALAGITAGDWEVTSLQGVIDGSVYFTATIDGPAERHLYRAALARPEGGARPERLTALAGWHEAAVSVDGAWIASVRSDVDAPPDLYVWRAGSDAAPSRVTVSPTPEFESIRLPVPEFITIASRVDAAPVRAVLLRPDPGAPRENLSRDGKHPAIVRVHGGGYAQSVRRAWGGTTFMVHALLTREGYYVLDLDYRGSSGYGRAWRTAVYMDLGGLDLEDAVSGADHLRSLPDVDPNRVAIWGWSYGGFLADMAMLGRPGAFNAGVAVAPVNDWAAYDAHYTEERLGRPQDNPEAYSRSNPLTFAASLRSPLLVIHGLQDDNVHAQDTIRLVDALVKAGREFDLVLYPEGKHGITRDASRIHLFRKMSAFLREKMPPGR